jgi:ribosome-binding protein aMBF1 (putative translation factor)
MESEDEQEFIVTEGWSEEDISELFENYSEEEIEDVLSEGIFSGIHPKVVKDITKGFTDFRGGEHSPHESTTVNNKSKTHTAIANKLNNHHVIVKHNGKVIATLHPLDNAARSEFHANNADGKEHRIERTEKWRSRTYQRNGMRFGGDINTRQYTDSRLTKGEAIEHAQNQITKHGGFDGHKVELHFIGKDEERPKIAKERSNNRLINPENPKTFENIAGRAADRVTGAKAKDAYSAKHYAQEAHEHKKNLDKAFESGNHKHAAVYASELANSLNKAHELGSINRTYDQKRANFAARNIGHRQDTNNNNLVDNSHANGFTQAVRRAKSGDSY